MKKMIPAMALLLLLTGCTADFLPEARQVENMALMRTMGVDAEGAGGGVAVTVSSGIQSKGINEGSKPPLVLSQGAGTVSGACLALQSRGDANLFFGHVGQLLLGEELAGRGVAEALHYVEQDIEMRLDTELFVIRGGTARAAISDAAGQDKAAADRLEAMEEDAGLMAAFMPRTVKDVLAGLAQNGASFAPAVSEGEEGSLNASGYAILKEDSLAGWAEGDAARGVNLLLDKAAADLLELPWGAGDTVALRLVGAKTEVRAVFEGEKLTGLELSCKVDANVAEAPVGLDLTKEEVRGRLTALLAERVRLRVRAAVTLSQGLDADFMGLGKRAGLSAPWHWTAIQEQWGDSFARLPVDLRVEAEIQRSYDRKG